MRAGKIPARTENVGQVRCFGIGASETENMLRTLAADTRSAQSLWGDLCDVRHGS